MERIFVSDKKYRSQVLFLLLCFVSFFISSQSAWGQTTLNLEAIWTAPTTNIDGSKLTDLASFNLYYSYPTDTGTPTKINTSAIPPTSGTKSSPYQFSVTIPATSGTVYFDVTAVDSMGNESTPSTFASYSFSTDTVYTNISGSQVTVDGKSYASGQTFPWTVGSKHTLAVTSPQNGSPGVRYVFTKWSNGPTSKAQTITVSSSDATYTANFTTVTEQVSTPTTPKNVTNGFTGTSYTFSSHSTSTFGNPVQYQYNWGDGSTSALGPATQSHIWIRDITDGNSGNPYQVTVTAKSSTGVYSSQSLAASVNIQEKPFIHITSPNGGETWVVGTTQAITWNSNYLNSTDTIYLYYWYAGGWYPITSLPANSITSTSSSYSWTIPDLPPTSPASGSIHCSEKPYGVDCDLYRRYADQWNLAVLGYE